jgi:molybdopterin-guanine dinucleotide biosynthesis protein A
MLTPPVVTVPAGLVLTGGAAQRMGGIHKADLLLAGRPLLAWVMDRLSPQLAGPVYLSVHHTRYAPLSRPDLLRIPDRRPVRCGPMAGIEAAMLAIPASWLLTVPVDTPFLPRTLVAQLMAAITLPAIPVIAATPERLHPTIALWPRALRPELTAALERGDHALYRWLRQRPHTVVPFNPPAAGWPQGVDPFFNVNTPQDLRRAEEYA